MNISKDWKAKVESAYSFMLKYSKITVWNKIWMNRKNTSSGMGSVYFYFACFQKSQKDTSDHVVVAKVISWIAPASLMV